MDWLFVSDVDDTLLGDDQALVTLADALAAARARLVLAYNSSRPCASLRRSLAEQAHLPRPDYLIGALGTEIQRFLDGNSVSEQAIAAYARQLTGGWQRDKIAALMDSLGFAAHADEFQTPLKASYHVPGEAHYRRVLEQLERHGVQANVIFSNNQNLDIIPAGADKGTAVDFLRTTFGLSIGQVVVAGDSANDVAMFQRGFKGIAVANADNQLKTLTGPQIYHARASHAGGVLEGLRHWGVVTT